MYQITETAYRPFRSFMRLVGETEWQGKPIRFTLTYYLKRTPYWSLDLRSGHNRHVDRRFRRIAEDALRSNECFASFAEKAIRGALEEEKKRHQPLLIQDVQMLYAKTTHAREVYRKGASLPVVYDESEKEHVCKLAVTFAHVAKPLLFTLHWLPDGNISARVHKKSEKEAIHLLNGYQMPHWRQKLADELQEWCRRQWQFPD